MDKITQKSHEGQLSHLQGKYGVLGRNQEYYLTEEEVLGQKPIKKLRCLFQVYTHHSKLFVLPPSYSLKANAQVHSLLLSVGAQEAIEMRSTADTIIQKYAESLQNFKAKVQKYQLDLIKFAKRNHAGIRTLMIKKMLDLGADKVEKHLEKARLKREKEERLLRVHSPNSKTSSVSPENRLSRKNFLFDVPEIMADPSNFLRPQPVKSSFELLQSLTPVVPMSFAEVSRSPPPQNLVIPDKVGRQVSIMLPTDNLTDPSPMSSNQSAEMSPFKLALPFRDKTLEFARLLPDAPKPPTFSAMESESDILSLLEALYRQISSNLVAAAKNKKKRSQQQQQQH